MITDFASRNARKLILKHESKFLLLLRASYCCFLYASVVVAAWGRCSGGRGRETREAGSNSTPAVNVVEMATLEGGSNSTPTVNVVEMATVGGAGPRSSYHCRS